VPEVAMTQPLQLVDANGEVIRSSCAACNEHLAQLESYKRDLELSEKEIRNLRRTVDALRRSKQKERDEYRQRARVEALWQMYQEIVGKKSSKLGAARFDAIRRMVELGYTDEHFECAFYGAKVACFVDGKGRRFDDVELICRNEAKFEASANKGAAAVKAARAALEADDG
jgi:hypothetical protein